MKLMGYILGYRAVWIMAIAITLIITAINSDHTTVEPQEFIPSDDGTLRDPTLAEAVWFMESDPTSDNPYTEHYRCLNFSIDTARRAIDAGIICYPVVIVRYPLSHAVVAFHTTDHGLQYFEPQNDRLVDPYDYLENEIGIGNIVIIFVCIMMIVFSIESLIRSRKR